MSKLNLRDFAAQVRQTLANVQVALAAAGAGMSDGIKLTVLVADHNQAKLAVLGTEVALMWQPLMTPA
jgi:enamine deaminase RidA (YjgF/YER057c/UK114 family)